MVVVIKGGGGGLLSGQILGLLSDCAWQQRLVCFYI